MSRGDSLGQRVLELGDGQPLEAGLEKVRRDRRLVEVRVRPNPGHGTGIRNNALQVKEGRGLDMVGAGCMGASMGAPRTDSARHPFSEGGPALELIKFNTNPL